MKTVQINIKTIITLMLVIAIFLTGALVGSPAKNNVQFIYVLIDIIAILHIIEMGRKKEKIIKDKMDIFVLILCLSSLIPILFGTYTSLNDSIAFALKYSSIFLVYLIVKENIKNDETARNGLIYTILTISAILVILGIDRMTWNLSETLTKFLDTTNLYQGEVRITSLFSYANSFAAMTGFGIFLALGQIIDTDKVWKKGICQATVFILLSGMILSLSRMMYVVMGIVTILFLIISKKKENRIETIEILGCSGILAVIYSAIFMKFLSAGNYTGIWISLLIFSIINFALTIIMKKINAKIFNIKGKILIKTGLIAIILGIICLAVIINIPENLVLFNTTNSEKKVERHLINADGNNKYLFEIEIDAKAPKEIFQISVLEKDKYWENVKTTNITLGDYQGKKEIEINTDESTKDIYLVFTTIETSENIKLEIRDLKINGKKQILNYKFLPYNFVSKIKNINFQTQSVWERGVYINDAFKLIKDNWILGIGGDGWHYRYGEIQDYNYVARETHSYPVQLLLEFGIVGILAYIIILIILIKRSRNIIKNSSNVMYQSILCAVLTIIIHSSLDFDLSFYYLLFITFVGIGILTSFNQKELEKKNIVKGNWITKGILIIIVSILTIINLKSFIVPVQFKSKITNTSTFEEKYEFYSKVNKLIPYNQEFKVKMIVLIEAYQFKYPEKDVEYTKEILENVEYLLKYEKYYDRFEMQSKFVNCSIKLLGLEKDEQMLYNIQEGYELIKNSGVQRKYSPYSYLIRKSGIRKIALKLIEKSDMTSSEEEKLTLVELAKKFYQLNIDEYEEDKNYLTKSINNEEERKEFLDELYLYKKDAIEKIEEL